MADVKSEVKSAGRSPWVERAGRLGLVAKGVVYALVATIAIRIPLGLGGEAKDRQGALRTVAQQSYGELALLAIAVGLAGYALWRIVQGVLDRDVEGSRPKGLAKRLGNVGKGVFYGFAAFGAFALVAGLGASSGDETEETARVFDLPAGRWIVAAVGVGFVAAGAYNAYRSVTQKFRKHLREHELAKQVRGWVVAVGIAGHAARGVVFGLIGFFLLRAAYEYDADEAIGLDGALRTLAEGPQGRWALFSVAAGLLAYALYCFVQARYRRI